MAASAQCRLCNDSGWIDVKTPKGPAASRCKCQWVQTKESLYQDLGLPPRFVDASIDRFNAGDYRANKSKYDTLTAALNRAKRFADTFPIGRNRGLLFYGGSPDEQSRLAIATLKRLVDRGFSGIYCDYNQLMVTLRNRYDSDPAFSEVAKKAAGRVARADVLLLDSLGDYRVTEWVLDTVSGVIKHRYYEQKCLLATTGLPLDKRRHEPEDGYVQMRRYTPVQDNLTDRIGHETCNRLLEHCDQITMAVPRDNPQGRFR